MEFFNKKEDVMDLELTPVGEILLSQGKFMPTHYAFFDDEILYDSEYVGTVEAQKDTKDRIKDTVRMKPQAVFRTMDKPNQIPAGGMKSFKLEQQFSAGPRILEQDPVTKNFALPLPLGKSSYDSVSLPAWNIKFWHGGPASTVNLLTSEVRPFLKIPQINAEIIYKSYKTSNNLPKGALSEAGKNKEKKKYSEFEELHEDLSSDVVDVTPDGFLYYDFDEDFIVLEVTEENTPYLKENFEIEVFEIEEQSSVPNEEEKELLIPKYFIKPPTHTKNDLLISFEEKQLQTEQELQKEFPDLNDNYVEYYFEISADEEIENKLMCDIAPPNKNKGVFLSDKYDCLDSEENIPITNIYGVEENNISLPDCE